jgi:hypothetical protein
MLPMEASRVITDYVVGRVRTSLREILISLGDIDGEELQTSSIV